MHPSDRLAEAVGIALGERIKSDDDFAADVWGALVFNRWFDASGEESALTYHGADATISEIRGGGDGFYMEGRPGPPPQEMQAAMAKLGWTWEPEE